MSTLEVTGIREGELLAGKYRVERILGAGGMGVVVAAHHVDLDERVAIKFLLPEVLGHGEAVARFAREARAAVKIKSEHVAKVTDVGKLENGAPYMVMEYLEGSDLAAWVAQRGALAIEQAVEFVLQACEAIAEAHALGIVHRDLKPANLFVIRRPDGVLSVKVLDFGISKTAGMLSSGAEASMTRTSAQMGSPLYMSPEQMHSSRDVDSRSDIWALGIILYELITGGPPFVADTMPELVLRVVHGAPPRALASRRPDAPPGLEAVILRCLEKDRRVRYESIGELAVALLPFAPKRSKGSVERISGVLRAAGLSASALGLPASSGNEAENVPATGTAASWGKTTPPGRRSTWLVAGGTVLLIGAGAFAWRATKGSGSSAAASASVTGEPASSPTPTVSPPSTPTALASAVATVAAAPAPIAVEPVAVPLASTSVVAPAALKAPPKVAHPTTAAKPLPPRAASPARPPAPKTVSAPRPDKPDIFDERK
jgi:eukaryotic-like serine/threonine-protein kinase